MGRRGAHDRHYRHRHDIHDDANPLADSLVELRREPSGPALRGAFKTHSGASIELLIAAQSAK